MKIMGRIIFFFLAVFQFPAFLYAQHGYPIKRVPLNEVKINDNFWSAWQISYRTGTLPNAITQVRDSTSRISNFEVAAGVKKGKFNGLVWDDSDVYKVMEGIAYSLQNKPDTALENLMDHWIDLMAKAQRSDGYLVTFYILSKEDDGLGKNLGPFSDIGRHEMYDGGHLIEAAVAYYHATGKTKFLDVAKKLADNWLSLFGPGKRHWAEGHQEPELALVKLYYVTNEKKYIDFARWLLDERGHGYEFGPMWERGKPMSNNNIITDKPVRDITDATGHAVREMYMFSGMTDIVANLNDTTYLPAINSVWDDVTLRNMYITGGIGSTNKNEGFSKDYDLPNKEAYCETCASVGMVLWSSRMNQFFGDAKYANVTERTMYNAAIAGVSLDGVKVNYTNPLESDGNHHRGKQYGIACCPSNIARFLPSIGNYVYLTKDNDLYVNLYVGSVSKIKLGETPVTVTQKTNYPWNGNVSIAIDPATAIDGKLKLRIPDWNRKYTIKINGKSMTDTGSNMDKGYLVISKKWKKGDVVNINFDMPVELVASDPNVLQNTGKRAIRKGPLVYCAEQADNKGIDLNNLTLSPRNKFTVINGDGVLKGIKKLQTIIGNNKITFIPYYAWDNREPGKMIVWTGYTN
jgi:DUF1680 family protein